MASEEVRGSFCRYDSCVITDQLPMGAGALERELLIRSRFGHSAEGRFVHGIDFILTRSNQLITRGGGGWIAQ